MKRVALTLALAAVCVAGAADAKKKPEMTPMEIQALQSHEYETSKEVLFASVVSVLQDLGYQLANADMGSGFITAASAMKNKTSIWDALAKQQGSGNTRVTAFVEGMPGGRARVRLNFLNTKTMTGIWGGNTSEDKPIMDPLTYKTAWDKIDEAVFTRTATAAPAATTTPVAETAAPAAISVPVTAGLKVSTDAAAVPAKAQ